MIQMANHWNGYWEQRGMGRQPMESLVLQFDNGVVRGSGCDIIGRFTFAGRMAPDGRVQLNKQYIGQHAVLYQGQFDGEGAIFGQWSIGPWDRGDFLLRLSRGAESQRADSAIEQIPAC
jgi:hypothetical protein